MLSSAGISTLSLNRLLQLHWASPSAALDDIFLSKYSIHLWRKISNAKNKYVNPATLPIVRNSYPYCRSSAQSALSLCPLGQYSKGLFGSTGCLIYPFIPVSAVIFPLLGQSRDFHPLECIHVGRTNNKRPLAGGLLNSIEI